MGVPDPSLFLRQVRVQIPELLGDEIWAGLRSHDIAWYHTQVWGWSGRGSKMQWRIRDEDEGWWRMMKDDRTDRIQLLELWGTWPSLDDLDVEDVDDPWPEWSSQGPTPAISQVKVCDWGAWWFWFVTAAQCRGSSNNTFRWYRRYRLWFSMKSNWFQHVESVNSF